MDIKDRSPLNVLNLTRGEMAPSSGAPPGPPGLATGAVQPSAPGQDDFKKGLVALLKGESKTPDQGRGSLEAQLKGLPTKEEFEGQKPKRLVDYEEQPSAATSSMLLSGQVALPRGVTIPTVDSSAASTLQQTGVEVGQSRLLLADRQTPRNTRSAPSLSLLARSTEPVPSGFNERSLESVDPMAAQSLSARSAAMQGATAKSQGPVGPVLSHASERVIDLDTRSSLEDGFTVGSNSIEDALAELSDTQEQVGPSERALAGRSVSGLQRKSTPSVKQRGIYGADIMELKQRLRGKQDAIDSAEGASSFLEVRGRGADLDISPSQGSGAHSLQPQVSTQVLAQQSSVGRLGQGQLLAMRSHERAGSLPVVDVGSPWQLNSHLDRLISRAALTGRESITVKLHPEDLGELTLRVSRSDGQATGRVEIQFEAGNLKAEQAIMAHAPELKRTLLEKDGSLKDIHIRTQLKDMGLDRGIGHGQGDLFPALVSNENRGSPSSSTESFLDQRQSQQNFSGFRGDQGAGKHQGQSGRGQNAYDAWEDKLFQFA